MSEPLEIRAARADDLDALLELYRQLNPDDPQPDKAVAVERLAAMLSHPGMTVLVGFAGAVAVATVTLVVIPNLTRGGASYALIENVVTHADHRRHGHAGTLIRAAIEHAWDAGCYKVMLLTGSQDPATHRFYKGCGFLQDKTGYHIRRA